ncbi:GNAT family N-acetyltransferase, partial [Virgibacillus salarius]
MVIRTYEDNDEKGWLRCRVLSFLDTAYFDDVRREKENYAHPSVELVAEEGNQIIGIMDIECEQKPNTICSNENIISGMIWHIAVHPDFQRKGVATALLDKAIKYLRDMGIRRIEAWTRDDRWVNSWYESNHFIISVAQKILKIVKCAKLEYLSKIYQLITVQKFSFLNIGFIEP